MKTSIEVGSRNEASAVQAALGDPAIKAFVTMIGCVQNLTKDEWDRAIVYFNDWIKTNTPPNKS